MTQHIASKTGDKGTTGLFDGKRYEKAHPIFDLLGGLDEISASLGLVKKYLPDHQKVHFQNLETIQDELLQIGAYFASLKAPRQVMYTDNCLELVEMWLAELEEKLPDLSVFIKPGGANGAAELHVARCVCRRVERSYWVYLDFLNEDEKKLILDIPGKYLNRLSDYLFQLARFVELDKRL